MKVTDREYHRLLVEVASRIFAGRVAGGNNNPWIASLHDDAVSILKACGIENEAESDPNLKVP